MASPRSTTNASKKKPVKKKPVKKKPVKKKPVKKKPRARMSTSSLGPTTTLVEIVRQLDDLDEDWTIYMRRPWSATAECVVAPSDEGGVPEAVKAAGYAYFLEIDVVKNEVLPIFDHTPGKPPTEDEKVRVILYYGKNDAWPEWVRER